MLRLEIGTTQKEITQTIFRKASSLIAETRRIKGDDVSPCVPLNNNAFKRCEYFEKIMCTSHSVCTYLVNDDVALISFHAKICFNYGTYEY